MRIDHDRARLAFESAATITAGASQSTVQTRIICSSSTHTDKNSIMS